MTPPIENSALDASPNGLPATVDAGTGLPEQTLHDATRKPPRPKRPNYALIHSKPLPLEVYPLPAFIPHNPLSVVRIAIKLISHSIWPPNSHAAVHQAYFSPETHSVHVTDPKSVRALWEHGFWGAGSLSRSEPQWLDQEKRKRGMKASLTSEEVTRERREVRRQFKLERARLEREAIEAQRRAEASGNGAGQVDPSNTISQSTTTHNDTREAGDEPSQLLADGVAHENVDVTLAAGILAQDDVDSSPLPGELAPVEIENQEHLQLTFEEAFFLTYALGALEISRQNLGLPTSYLLRLFSIYSEFPLSEASTNHVQDLYRLLVADSSAPCRIIEPFTLAPDNPFLLKYITFHHFRSLGWVVRPGIKFAVDYLLYNRGPAFTHAEFAVMIIPSYSNPFWNDASTRRTNKERKDWWWLHRINRVQTQVHKSLMLVYIEVPPPWDEGTEEAQLDIATILKKYTVREFILKRWSPNRQRG